MSNPVFLAAVLVQYFCLLFSLCVHEAAHAAMADRCGDPSARLMGRATLNPLAHIDILGTVIMPLIMMFSQIPFLFGWAKPVPYNPRNLRNLRRDSLLIAIAGPGSNLLIAALFVLLARISSLLMTTDAASSMLSPSVLYTLVFLRLIFGGMITINLVLAFFNFIPVPPLDGHHILEYFLPPKGQQMLESIGPYGIFIAIILARPLFRALNPVLDGVMNLAGL